MEIPGYQEFMLPLLKYAADNEEHLMNDAIEALTAQFSISEEDKRKLLPSGQPVVNNRIGWARTYLVKAGLLESPKRGVFRITQRGLDFLKQNPTELNTKTLMQFGEFVEFYTGSRNSSKLNKDEKQEEIKGEINNYTPQEALEYGLSKINETLADDLLDAIMKCSPSFFEKLVIDLLVKMGYGGSRQEAAQVVGKSGDEGIDGIIKEDKLGLDVIYVQAKRWGNVPVGRPEIQKFAGAILGQKSPKGIFITTSSFTNEAKQYAETSNNPKLVLIDGKKLAELMIEYGVGVTVVEKIEIKKIDADYFEEDI